MEVRLLKNKKGETCGWSLYAKPGQQEDIDTLGEIRHFEFYGLSTEGTHPKYAGARRGNECIIEVLYNIPKFMDESKINQL